MTTAEKLQKHVDTLEERKVNLFFDMQKLASIINSRTYSYYILIAVLAMIVFSMGYMSNTKNAYLIIWSNIFAIITLISVFIQYLINIENTSKKLYNDICSIYKLYDDEYYILKKFNSGEIKEDIIRQFYINKSKETQRYHCHVIDTSLFIWTTTALLTASIVLLLLA